MADTKWIIRASNNPTTDQAQAPYRDIVQAIVGDAGVVNVDPTGQVWVTCPTPDVYSIRATVVDSLPVSYRYHTGNGQPGFSIVVFGDRARGDFDPMPTPTRGIL